MAPCTAHGRAALAVVRLSGPRALDMAGSVWRGADLGRALSHTAHLGRIVDREKGGECVDQAVATVYRAPGTFTGEDMVEFSLHGSPYIVRETLRLLGAAGARPAGPGEFSLRAVRNGRMSLTQAEAAADLTAAASRAAHRVAMTQMNGSVSTALAALTASLLKLASLLELELDFSEEDVEFAPRPELLRLATEAHHHLVRLRDSFATGNAIKEGIPVAIVGATNAGKSSLLNALLGSDRAIVSDVHGTTRDVVEDTAVIGDYTFRFMDTAGLRHTADPVERIGMERSRRAAAGARIVVHVVDATAPAPLPDALELPQDATVITVFNKCDIANGATYTGAMRISAKTGAGVPDLLRRLTGIASADEASAGDIVLTNERHLHCIEEALPPLESVIAALSPDAPAPLTPDLIAQELRAATAPLQALTGEALQTPAMLQNIFSHFCIGK